MKTTIKTLIFSFLLAIISFDCNAQNILPLTWNISFKNESCFTTRRAKQHSSVNALLSWERQGYFAGDGDCELSNIFGVSNLKSQYVLDVRMACDVNRIVINGDTIAKDIKNRFWKNKDTIESFVIARNILHKSNNKISINCSSLGYTGGVSNTMIALRPVNGDNIESI